MLLLALCLTMVLRSALPVDQSTFVPPGAGDRGVDEELFGVEWEFEASPRLHGRRLDTIVTVNDWHYAMMNDRQRNDAFYAALAEVVTANSIVLDIGAGSGLLSLMAAKLGAQSVLAIEANQDIAELARAVVHDNGQDAEKQGGAVRLRSARCSAAAPAAPAPAPAPQRRG